MTAHESDEQSTLLQAVRDGDRDAQHRLLELIYPHLRRAAGELMRAERADHTLQPTALVHEAVLRLFRAEVLSDLQSLRHARALVARAMHRVLLDHARTRGRDKRGGALDRVPLADVPAGRPDDRELDLADALDEFEAFSPDQAEVVRLHYYGGWTNAEVAGHLGVSLSKVESDLRAARAWPRRRLGEGFA